MANSTAAFGLRPTRHLFGGVIRANPYAIANNYATTLGRGDPVKIASDGTIQRAAAGDTQILGSFQGVYYVDSTGKPKFDQYYPGSIARDDTVAMVVDDPNVEFAIVANAGTLAAADVGANVDLGTVAAASTTTHLSTVKADVTAGSGTANLRILGKLEVPNNDWGADVTLRVRINEHAFVTTTGV